MRRAAPCGAILLGGSNRLEEMNVPNNRLDFPDGSVLTVLESAAEQNRNPLVMEFMVPHGGMPTAPHLHPRQVETYTV
jgi:hypothetical protein